MDKKEKLLITGATGNVGRALLKHFDLSLFEVYAAVRDIEKARTQMKRDDIRFIKFDFETGTGFDMAEMVDGVFLLRPPQIADIRKIRPFLERLKLAQIKKLVFLSVQGADKKAYIPHSKIEKAIRELDLPYIFIRPSYFMDNLMTTLSKELTENRRIFLPAGNLKFNWIDVDDIGRAAATLFKEFSTYKNSSVLLTNSKNLTFKEVVSTINAICSTSIKYESPGLIRYVRYMRSHGESWQYIGIMLLLHYLPRMEKQPEISGDFKQIMHEDPHTLEDFVRKHREFFLHNVPV